VDMAEDIRTIKMEVEEEEMKLACSQVVST
jgi:hypothetical protein